MQLTVLVLCGHFLLNEIPSRLDFLLGRAVVEHQDVSEHSLPSAEIHLISKGHHNFILLLGCHYLAVNKSPNRKWEAQLKTPLRGVCLSFPLAGEEYWRWGASPSYHRQERTGLFLERLLIRTLTQVDQFMLKIYNFFYFWREYCQGWKQFRWLGISFSSDFFFSTRTCNPDIFILVS